MATDKAMDASFWEKLGDGLSRLLRRRRPLPHPPVRLQQRALHPQARLHPRQRARRHRTPSSPARCSPRSTRSKRRCRPSPTRSCKALTPQFRERLANGRDARRPAARGVRRLPRGRPPHQEHAALRRADPRRRRAAPRQHRRDGHRRRQDPRRHPAGLPQRPGRQGRPRRHRQRLPRPPRLRVDAADLPGPRHHGRLHPERHGPRRPPQGLRLRHHLRHQQRVRLRLPARQHEAGPLGRPATSTRTTSSARRPLNYAIIDEVDNILIDEARTPLIISGPAFSDVRRYAKANDIAVAAHRPAEEGAAASTSRSRRRSTPAT